MPVKILTTEQQLGSISEYLNNKVDLPRGLSQGSVDYVIEKLDPTAENNYTWYRLYKSGWVEQGGNQTINDSGSTISLPIYMNNNKYFLSVGYIQHSDGTTMPSTYDLTTINFKVNPEGWWKVSGQSSWTALEETPCTTPQTYNVNIATGSSSYDGYNTYYTGSISSLKNSGGLVSNGSELSLIVSSLQWYVAWETIYIREYKGSLAHSTNDIIYSFEQCQTSPEQSHTLQLTCDIIIDGYGGYEGAHGDSLIDIQDNGVEL